MISSFFYQKKEISLCRRMYVVSKIKKLLRVFSFTMIVNKDYWRHVHKLIEDA